MSARDEQEMLSAQGVAALYGVDGKTVTRWARAGRLIAVETPGGHRRYPAAQFAAIIAARQAAQAIGDQS